MSLHAEENRSEPKTASGRVTLFLFGLGVATFICGVWSFFGIGPSGPQCQLELESIWTRVYRLVALFEFSEVNVHIGECYIGWQIEVARFTGPFATIVLVVRVLMEVLRGPLERLRLQRFSGHTVIVGFGEKGKVRAIEAASSGVQVVAIDNAPGEASHAVAARYGIVLLVGDALAPGGTRQRGSLSRVRLRHARRFVVATGDDSRNLSIAQIIAAQVRREPGADREIEVSLGDPLIRRALGADADHGLIDAFAIEDSAAYWLCESARFFAVADLLGQHRLHIVILGFDRLGVSLTAQILRSSQTADLGVARITILSASTTDARALLLLSYPGIEAVAEIAYIAADPRGVAIDDNLMAEIEAAAPITAVVVLGDRSAETLPVALAVRDASRRTGRWMAPIFFGIEHAASLMDFSRPLGEETRFSKVLHPFEISAHLCTREYIEERDRVAGKIHEAYREAFAQMQAAGQRPSTGNEALVPWRQLPRTYRQANRRAGDHITAKFLSAGCVVPPSPASPSVTERFDLLADEGALERLAELEHRVWAADRELDGWRPGKIRDDSRRIHDCLIPYAELPDATKELDRAQVRELNAVRIPRVAGDAAIGKRLVRFDLWVGLIGSRSLNHAEAEWARDALKQTILPRLLDAHPEHNFTLLSPLAPGADLIATKAMFEGLVSRKVQHRLLVIEAVPMKEVVEQFGVLWGSGAVGDLDLPAQDLTWPQARSALTACIAKVPCERILELEPVALGAAREDFEAGYRRQNAYIVQRAQVVIAIVKPPDSTNPGGTGEAIAWRRDRSTMTKTMPFYERRPNRAAAGFPGLIIVDIGERKIVDKFSSA